ncbi:MAG: hypothetical protein Q8L98_00905 [Chlamydiales bacterium]|nr:hypothetical protein [Chlamydiales bacterium]
MSVSESSLSTFCSNGRVVVYGFKDCSYIEVMLALKSRVKEVYSWALGQTPDFDREFVELTKNTFVPLVACWSYKKGLVHLVLDNYRRQLNGESITFLVFCIDSDKNPYPKVDAETIFSKETKFNKLYTLSELRRIAKLCFDESVHSDVRKVALDTFKFVCVQHQPNSIKMHLEKVEGPFTGNEFSRYYSQRRKDKNPSEVGVSNWRSQLEERRKLLEVDVSNQREEQRSLAWSWYINPFSSCVIS